MLPRWQAIIELWPISTSDAGRFARVHAVEEVLHVRLVHVAAAAAARLARHAVRLLAVLRFRLRQHFPAAAIDDEHAVVAVEGDAVVAHVWTLSDGRGVLPDQAEAVVFPQRLLRIRRLFRIVRETELAADRRRPTTAP